MKKTSVNGPEALALFEIDGIARAMVCHDVALKRAAVEVFACAPISPGRSILIFGGCIADVEESLQAVDEAVGSRQVDRLYLPQVHQDVFHALQAERKPRNTEALGIFELASVAASIESADAAVKNAAVFIGRLHAATGFGGKGYFTVCGSQSDVEAAAESVALLGGDRVLDTELIAAPHAELDLASFKRPWPLDPAGV